MLFACGYPVPAVAAELAASLNSDSLQKPVVIGALPQSKSGKSRCSAVQELPQKQLSTGKRHKLKGMHDPDRHLSTLERLMADQASLMWLWSRMASLLVENKHPCGLGHWSDRKVADNAQRVFDALLRICLEASRERLSRADRLAAFGWFLDACQAEFEGQSHILTRH
jgi:hypothetical protein